jgi:hypothetical protein
LLDSSGVGFAGLWVVTASDGYNETFEVEARWSNGDFRIRECVIVCKAS